MRRTLFAICAAIAAAVSVPTEAAQPGAAAAGADTITFEQYREWRLNAIERRRSELAVRLAAADLAPPQKTRIEETRAYYEWLAGLPAADRDRRFRERFDRIDANRDGTIDADERAAWRDKQRAFYKRDRPARHQSAGAEAR